MRVVFFSNKFPGVDLRDLSQRLRFVSRSRSHGLLRRFLEEATMVAHEEIRRLPPELKTLIPPFQSILDLVDSFDWHGGPLTGVFECAFTCLFHISLFLGSYERNPQEFNFSNSTFTGLGLGLLAATGIVASQTLLDVPQTSAEAVRIAMRTGYLLYQKQQEIEPQEPDAPPKSWSVILKNMDQATVQETLDHFNASIDVSITGKLYISVIEPDGSLFVNGPPSILAKIFGKTGKLASARHAALPVYGGPCHAAHLYDRADSAHVAETVSPKIANRRVPSNVCLLSMVDGKPLGSQTVLELFESAIYCLLTGTIQWGNVAEAIFSSPDWNEEAHVRLESIFQPCPVVNTLISRAQATYPHCTVDTREHMQWVFMEENKPTNPSSTDIAVVGMSCRLPGGANDLTQFWELLVDGRDVHKKIPADRYDVETHTDTTGKRQNTSHTPFGCFIDDPGLFDNGFFGMSPREAGQTDPAHRLALLTAYEALEQSGFVPNRTPSTMATRVGTYYGHCSDDYREANAGQDIDTYFIPGNYRAFAPGRISYFFKFSGPSYSIDTACSASLAAIQIACSALIREETDTVVAGGLNLLTGSDSFAGLSRGYFLSKTGSCKVFDDGADGYCRADGIVSIVMKRLADAQNDNDNILGIIRASATNHAGNASSITHPHAPTQEHLFSQILKEANVNALDVDVIEMHGTGTQAGDTTEMESVTNVFCPGLKRRLHPLYVSSVKANVGHGEAAAGITALVKALLMFQKSAIPKHVGIKTAINKQFRDLGTLNVKIPMETVSWAHDNNRRRFALVNNFSAAGGSTCLLLQEPPVRSTPQACPHPTLPVAVSAKSKVSLKNNIRSLITYLQQNPSSDLPSLSYTTTARRMHYRYRVVVNGGSTQELIRRLQTCLNDVEMRRPIPKRPSVAFVFSGQGSFYTSIGRQLFEEYPPYREKIQRLDKLCLLHGFPSIIPLILSQEQDTAAVMPLMTQLLTTCVQIALTDLWRMLGVKPDVVIGASLGEYAALHAAGVLSASDAIFLVGRRALLLQELCTIGTHGMVTVRASVDEICECLPHRKEYEVACINAQRNVTIAGPVEHMDDIQASLESNGYSTTKLNVPFAFHSAHVEPILRRFGEISRTVTFHSPKASVLSPLLADNVTSRDILADSYLERATRAPVRFAAALERAQEMGIIHSNTAFIEIGVHQTYSNAVRATVRDMTCMVPSMRSDQSNWSTFAASMSALHEVGVEIDWNEWYRPFEPNLRLLTLPSYQWDMKKHWIQYNGNWLLLKDKGLKTQDGGALAPVTSAFQTPLLHQILEESSSENGHTVLMQSNIMEDQLLKIISGHKMCGRPVMSVFAYPDMALSLANYIYTKHQPQVELPSLDFGNVQIFQGLVARKSQANPQWLRVRADADLKHRSVRMSFEHALEDGHGSHETLATGVVTCGDSQIWSDEWGTQTDLLISRIEVLYRLAQEGQASRLSGNLVYSFFKTLVDYSEKYRGIQSVVLHHLEGVAEVLLPPGEGGWTAAPNYIDSVSHVAGFILNGSNALDDHDTVYVMDGWKSMRFSQPLVPGARYQSYTSLKPAKEKPGFYISDVFVIRDGQIVGQIRGMTMRPLPRILLRRFFDPPEESPMSHKDLSVSSTISDSLTRTHSPISVSPGRPIESIERDTPPSTPDDAEISPVARNDSGLVKQAMGIIASETSICPEELTDDVEFANIGVDSLLSLVLVEKFALGLHLNLRASVFQDCPSVGSFKEHLVAA
ncbi:non-reducing polyketide synthase encA [Aspergillus luchuensis]|uniref:Type I iterative PKS n=1 Tax=Aspergillus kawachii TaxID=1069201 RepID=A0A7R7WUX5_ASPKA|nr:type I iterative PKS [Aspergillus luchuensis]BCR97118.1 type I iterative PKS [Aspergillus luchuensis]BCS09592.1 type I iterative PKS [Aspergillus luchuensis]GAA88581.1 polyketide synthase [Aspergillus luchuensis IFO 4308]